MTDTYTITVYVDRRYAPGLRRLVDAVADELERCGASERDYDVRCDGPPELTIGGVSRG